MGYYDYLYSYIATICLPICFAHNTPISITTSHVWWTMYAFTERILNHISSNYNIRYIIYSHTATTGVLPS